MNKISAVIITKNEENNIEKCLESLKWVDEIVIIDSYSTDKTLEKAKKFTKFIYQNEWKGFSEQRNYGAQLANNDWIISVDADERIGEELANEIISNIEKGNHVAYQIPMQNYVFNRWMKYSGLASQYHIRLYNKKYCNWSSLIHEDIDAQGSVGILKNKMFHLAYKNASELIFKIDKYTELEAENLIKATKKPNIIKLLIYPQLIFIYKYFIQLGFLDGIAGFGWAIGLSFYHNIKIVKYFIKKAEETK